MGAAGRTKRKWRWSSSDAATRRHLIGAPLVVGLYLLLQLTGAEGAQHIEFVAVEALCVWALVGGIVRHRPSPRWPWILLAVAQGAITASTGIYHLGVYGRLSDATTTLLTIVHVALTAVAVAGWVLHTNRRDVMTWIDVAITLTVSAFLSWTFVVAPLLSRHDVIPEAKAVIVAFSVLNLTTLALTFRFWLGSRTQTASLRFFVAGYTLWFLGDALLVARLTHDAEYLLNITGPLELLAVVLLASAAGHSSMATIAAPSETEGPTFSGRRLVVLGLATLVPPLVHLGQYLRGGTMHVPAVVAACLLVSVLVTARMMLLVREQRGLAIIDALTGLHTRRFFEEALTAGLDRSKQHQGDVGLLLIDVDHFKKINDTFGHPTGDLVLQRVAQRLRDATRSGDVVARYGGEEFAILLPRTKRDQLVPIAERIRAAVAGSTVTVDEGSELTVTVSIGIAASAQGEHSPDDLVLSADQRLYEAKSGGRNRVAPSSCADGACEPGAEAPDGPGAEAPSSTEELSRQ